MTNELIIASDVDEAIGVLLNMEQARCTTTNDFTSNMWLRTMELEAGALVIGEKHKQSGFFFLLKGKMLLKTHMDDEGVAVEAPYYGIAAPGQNKIGYAITDILFANVDLCSATDEDGAFEECIDLNEQKIEYNKNKALADKRGYEKFLINNNLTEEQVQKFVHTDNVVEIGIEGIEVRNAGTTGKGVFAIAEIPHGKVIGPHLLNKKRTELGRWLNHSETPNAEVSVITLGVDTELLCISNITQDEEITINYNDAFNKQKELITWE